MRALYLYEKVRGHKVCTFYSVYLEGNTSQWLALLCRCEAEYDRDAVFTVFAGVAARVRLRFGAVRVQSV